MLTVPATPKTRVIRFKALGAHAEYINSDAREKLLEGPFGTGKTRTVLTRDHERLKANPGLRCLWIRKTLVSLRNTVLQGFEDDVAPGFPWKNPGATRAGRTSYQYPNGSEILLVGMNNPLALRSGEHDFATYFESHQSTRNEIEEILGRIRRFSSRFCDLTCDTNPAHRGHHLYKRSRRERNKDGSRKMKIFRSRHWMNPKYFDIEKGAWTPQGEIYVQGTLANMTGMRLARGYKGWWVSQSGQVWETFDEGENLIGREDVPGYNEDPALEVPLDWYFGSMDWGWSHAGVLQIWGVKHFPPPVNFKMYRVALVYRTGKTIDWWAQVASMLQKRYELPRIVCDPSRPDAIASMNDAIGRHGGEWVAIGADNRKRADKGEGGDLGGIDGVRTGFCDGYGVRRIYFVDPEEAYVQDPDPEDDSCCIGGPDQTRMEDDKPLSDVEEIPDYMLAEPDDSDLEAWVPDRPADRQDDDGCDTTRYAYQFASQNNFSTRGAAPIFEEGTAGEALDHEATLRGRPAFLGMDESKLYGDDGQPVSLEEYYELMDQ